MTPSFEVRVPRGLSNNVRNAHFKMANEIALRTMLIIGPYSVWRLERAQRMYAGTLIRTVLAGIPIPV
jgi:hypothetical protein